MAIEESLRSTVLRAACARREYQVYRDYSISRFVRCVTIDDTCVWGPFCHFVPPIVHTEGRSLRVNN